MTLKNITLKILTLVSLKKIPLDKNIVKGAFFSYLYWFNF